MNPSTTTSSSSSSNLSIRVNFDNDSQTALNKLVNLLYSISYECQAMQYFWNREEQGMFGLALLNRFCAIMELRAAKKLMDYIVTRGGRVEFSDIPKPPKTEFNSPVESLQNLLDMKKVIQQTIMKVHDTADKNQDEHLKEYLEVEFLEPVIVFTRKVGVLIANLKRAGTGLGEYQFNKDLEIHFEEIFREREIKHQFGERFMPIVPKSLETRVFDASPVSVSDLIRFVKQ